MIFRLDYMVEAVHARDVQTNSHNTTKNALKL